MAATNTWTIAATAASLLFLVNLVVNLLGGVYAVWHKYRNIVCRPTLAAGQPHLTGITGWLLVFILMLWLQVILAVHFAVALGVGTWPARVAMLGAVLAGTAAYLLGRKMSLGLKLAKLLLFCSLLIGLLSLVGWLTRHGSTYDLYRGIETVGEAGGWFLYLFRSERVKEIFH